MAKLRIALLLVLAVHLFSSCLNTTRESRQFGAYYTHVGAKDSITGRYADLVVKVADDMQLIFCRDSGYLPYLTIGDEKWYVDAFFEKRSNESSTEIDEFNKYSYVRIIENTAEKIIVHWRYIPDMRNIGFRSVVHEYFIITPDRRVSRIIRAGDFSLNVYKDPKSSIVQEMKLTINGIKELSLKEAEDTSVPNKAIKGSPIKDQQLVKPVAWWKFDEGLKESDDHTFESIGNSKCPVAGNITLWKQGISGTALAFDGYDSKVVTEPGKSDFFKSDFTIEAWIVLGAYPWEWGPVIDYTAEDSSGLYFGVNSDGKAVIMLNKGAEKAVLISKVRIPLYQWTHMAASYDKPNNLLGIYVDGVKAGEIETGSSDFKFNKTEISIGLNKWPKRTANHVSRDYPPEIRTPMGNQARIYGIEGLIDEVKIYDKAIGSGELAEIYQLTKPSNEIRENPDLEKRILPGEVNGENAKEFHVYYTSLKFHELWDNMWRSSDYPDLVVKFDELPVSIIYWRGTNYGPSYVTENNKWMSDQSSETGTEFGCAEHMADKQNRYSHVRIIENTPARILVHWRYASADITYQLSEEKAWTDEYHYIYPDGTLLRFVHWYTGEEGFQDLQFLSAPGEKQEDIVHLQAMSIANIQGDIQDLDWSDGIPRTEVDHATIASINFKSEYKVFAIFPKEVNGIAAWGVRERATAETHFAGPWNHWPVGQMPNDGNYAMHTDRVSSSALGGSNPRYMAMYGFTNEKIQKLIPVDQSWNYAPGISNIEGAESRGYEREQKAYSFSARAHEFSFTINASPDKPLHNPCFEIENWNTNKEAELRIDGKIVNPGKSFRQGITLDQNGKDKLLIWLELTVNSGISFNISGAAPGSAE